MSEPSSIPHPASSDASHEVPPAPRRGSRGIPLALGTVLLCIVAAVLFMGVWPAFQRRAALAESAVRQAEAPPKVLFVEPTPAPPTVEITLPARTAALQETALYPQAGGYLGPMLADMGDVVKADQILVEIQTPVLDRQIEQNHAAREVARARIDLATARLNLATATLARLRSVGDARAISQQAIDEAAANEQSDAASLQAARADLAAVEADGRRLEAQKSLARIVAPFDGEITERNYDTGALVVADRTDGSRPIFRITNREEIRVFVDVPQAWAPTVRVGDALTVKVKDLPEHAFNATITRTAPSLDPATRTRLVEARIPNADHILLPGMFAEVELTLPRPVASVLVPGEAIVVRNGRTALVLIDEQETVRYLPVELGRDTGTRVEVLTPLPPGSRLIVNLARQLPEGTKVQAIPR